MYAYIKGALKEAALSSVVIEANGIGYYMHIPFNNFSLLPAVESEVLLYTTYVVREESQKLFGFLTIEQRDLFESLIDISGIGPKTALCLVGHMPMDELRMAISQANTQLICKIPGIGKKTAERLIVEMRDKIQKSIGKQGRLNVTTSEQGIVADAISALINLGYNSAQAQKAVKAVVAKAPDEQELAKLITTALRNI